MVPVLFSQNVLAERGVCRPLCCCRAWMRWVLDSKAAQMYPGRGACWTPVIVLMLPAVLF